MLWVTGPPGLYRYALSCHVSLVWAVLTAQDREIFGFCFTQCLPPSSQGLIRHFRPELEDRMQRFAQQHQARQAAS